MSVPQLRFKAEDGRAQPDWCENTLLNLSENGFTNGVFNDPNKTGRGYKLVNVLDMYIDSTIDEKRLSLVELSEDEFKKNKVEHGEIFFTRSSLVKGGIAYSNVYLGNSQDITFDGHLIRMRPRSNVLNSVFANYLLRTSKVRKQLVARGKTATMTTIGQADIAAVVVAFPSLTEQTKIANFLTAVDEKLSQLTQKCELLKQYKKGVMQQIFSQALRFKDENGRNFPDWDEYPLGSVAKLYNGRAYKHSEWETSGIPVIRLQNLTNSSSNYYYSNIKLPDKQYCDKGDLLYMWSATFGPVWWRGEKAIYHYHIWKIETDSRKLSKNFLFFILDDITAKMKNTSNGSTMSHITKGGIEKLGFQLPVINEQNKIASFLISIDDKINNNQNQLAAVKQYKQALIQQIFV